MDPINSPSEVASEALHGTPLDASNAIQPGQVPNIEVPEAPVPNHSTIQPSDNSSTLPILSMAIFVLLSLGAVAFLYYQNQQLKGMLANYQSTPVTSPTPVATVDLTANWKTYINPSKTYSFKYPDGLKSDTGAAGSGFESIRFTFMGQKQIDSGRTQTELSEGYMFIVTKVGLTSAFDPKKAAEKQQTGSTESCKNISDLTKVKIDGFDGFSIGCIGESTTTFVSDGKSTYSITEFYTGDNKDTYKKTTDQILSTFKFISQSASPSATPSTKPVACTMEAKICPDGSSVGRTGPNCEFAPCPTVRY